MIARIPPQRNRHVQMSRCSAQASISMSTSGVRQRVSHPSSQTASSAGSERLLVLFMYASPSGRTGMHEILLHEDMSNVDIMLQPHGIAIAHSADLPVKPIEVSLWKFFYDMEFTRCLRLSVLNSRCPASQPLFLNPAQYALLQEMKLAVIRGLGLTEIFMEENGRACLYGSVESVLEARATIKQMFDEHGLGDPEVIPAISCKRSLTCRPFDRLSIEDQGGYFYWISSTFCFYVVFKLFLEISFGEFLGNSNISDFLANQKHDSDCVAVLKVVQRFRKQPNEWPIEEQPFGIIERNFVGKMMHPIELRPERGFVNMVPFGLMMLRHFFRKVWAKGNYELFKSTGIFNEEEVCAGTKRVFEIISQHALKNRMAELVTRNFCSTDAARRFDVASNSMSARQRGLLNLTEHDVFAIAPGVLGPYQLIRSILRGRQPFITYSLLCCAFYKKQMLFDAVRELPLVDSGEEAQFIAIPDNYGYAAPRLIFAFITFGNKILGKFEVDGDIEVLGFQYLVI
ncbi:unnamed protein product [Angiostrongylus costaricensis]|uniref:GST N-terminal domain-containing protein n=1 Tax=Angiostrongylus costaricensis TaxID=334426 RepID=A0A158PJG9_ANGCS|nr:unnamed protein product [Angiostrongylus costaricensis]